MDWTEEGVVLAVRKHGESAAIVELLTRDHGRHMGLVHGGVSRRLKPVLQPGNTVLAHWRARIAEHLGNYQVDLVHGRAGGLMHDPLALGGLSAACAMASAVLPEREPHGPALEGMLLVLDHLAEPAIWPLLFVRWEAGLLQELGFGLDVSQCAATGATGDLVYVSPRSGRAVSRAAGGPYHERLLRLPGFLGGQQIGPVSFEDLRDGFVLTGYFLGRYVLEPHDRKMPPARERMIALLRSRRESLSTQTTPMVLDS